MARTLVIAEPGCTAQGDYATMLRLIDTAAECGADVFKTTWLSSAQRLCERRNAHDYKQAYEWHQWPIEWHGEFRKRCTERGLQYACTVDLPEDVLVLEPLVDYLKIASFEADSRSMRTACLSVHPDKLIVSTGMKARHWRTGVRMLHCVSAYPAPCESLNLGAIRSQHYDGYSDHSRDVKAGMAAVCAGAAIIETHFRLDDCDPKNPDYAVAFSPLLLSRYIANIRTAECMMGDGVKKLEPCEEAMQKYRAK